MGTKYFKTTSGFIGVTSECPRGFKGVLFVGRGPIDGGDITTVKEQLFEATQLKKLKPVNLADVPEPWLLAIGLDEPVAKPEPVSQPSEQVMELDISWFPFVTPPAAPKKLTPAEKRQADWLVLAMVVAAVVIAFLRM